jgi:adenosylmethionine-8-amino-7-oxononanoate aminotransferase
VATVRDRAARAREPRRASLRDTALWHSQAHMPSVRGHEVVIDHGKGAYVWDDQGRRLLDAPASLWYCNVGHGRAEIADAVAAQMKKLETYSTFQQYATRPALELAERVAALAPIDGAKVFLTSGGSDAIDTMAKLIRRYWNVVGKPEKRTIVTRECAYHGLHAFGTSIAGLELNREGYGPLITDSVVVPTNDAGALEELVHERGAETIAAFFFEPIIGTGGVIHPAPGYLERVQEICREHDILLVADEVITGFGRTGRLFASERFGLQPDAITVAKGITSGYLPLGAAIVGERLWAPFWDEGSDLVFRHGLTYAGHASACAAALVNLDIIDREKLVERVRSLEGVLESALRPLESHELVREVRSGIGLLTGIELHDPVAADDVARACAERGVLTRVLPPATLHVSPPFVIDESDIELLARAISSSLDEVAP